MAIGKHGAVLVAAIAILLWVALANGGPIVYPDSIAYLIDGERITHLVAPYAVRAVFYGVAIYLLQWGGWVWLALAVQAGIVAHLLWLTARVVGAGLRGPGFLLLVAALSIATPLPWHVAHLLPDIFVAVAVLALFLLGFCADDLSRGERIYLVLLLAAAASFHLTALPVALATLALLTVWRCWDRAATRPLLALLPIGLALAGSLMFNGLVWHRVTLAPNSPPFLLARLLADGPARDFLRERCPAPNVSGEPFELCRDLAGLPATEEQFMWGYMAHVTPERGRRIKAEASAVVLGAIKAYPMRVAELAVRNGLRQMVTFGSETALSDAEWADFEHGGHPIARWTSNTLQARRWFERPNLDQVNAAHAAVATLALLASGFLLIGAIRAGARRPTALLLTVQVALVANAFATGPISGVFARFEGRVIWLLPFAAVTAALALRVQVSHRTPSLEGSEQGPVVQHV